MNILVINCSPVKNGATAEIVKLVSQYVKNGNSVESGDSHGKTGIK